MMSRELNRGYAVGGVLVLKTGNQTDHGNNIFIPGIPDPFLITVHFRLKYFPRLLKTRYVKDVIIARKLFLFS